MIEIKTDIAANQKRVKIGDCDTGDIIENQEGYLFMVTHVGSHNQFGGGKVWGISLREDWIGYLTYYPSNTLVTLRDDLKATLTVGPNKD